MTGATGNLRSVRTRWFSRRALGLHATVLIVVTACVFLGWWQLSRALGGNNLSWVYTFEWPFFALYALYMWWKLVHEPLKETRAPELAARREREDAERLVVESLAQRVQPEHESRQTEDPVDLGFDPYDESDPELAAYNRYLASLHAADATRRRRPSRERS